jgi:hypothetical protein
MKRNVNEKGKNKFQDTTHCEELDIMKIAFYLKHLSSSVNYWRDDFWFLNSSQLSDSLPCYMSSI